MSLPPERISIKRRRQDDPVEALLLEQAPSRDKKRRATDFLFRRLRADEVEDIRQPPRLPSSGRQEKQKQRSASQNDNSGVPQIRATLPGDEIKDMQALKDAVKSQMGTVKEKEPETNFDGHKADQEVATFNIPTIKVPTNARRFHLSREHNVLGPSRQHGGIRKPAHRAKTHLATFVEKSLAHTDQLSQVSGPAPPINRIVEVKSPTSADKSTQPATDCMENQGGLVTKHVFDQPFVKPPTNGAKQGRTINTHPNTWDFDSDQLASELAAFAFELDPTGNNEHVKSHSTSHVDPTTSEVIMEGEYVYETYIRLPQHADIQAAIVQNNLTAKIGVLVIAEEDEDLWEAYAESDDENEWDEEDADSNAEDNPANDYPEDEVSDDDEFGLGAYNHRRNASDDEEYDFERDE